MSDAIDKKNFNVNQKIRIAKVIFKDKNGNIVGEYDNEYKGYETG